MQIMSSKKIKDHYGEFVNIARKQGVVHTSHNRTILVSVSFEEFEDIANSIANTKPKYKNILESLKNKDKCNSILDFSGKGKTYSNFKSNNDINNFIDNLRSEWN